MTLPAKCGIILCKLTVAHLGWREIIMKHDSILTHLLIFLGICGYVTVLSLTALTHCHDDADSESECSESECSACFYQAHRVHVESYAFASVSPAISYAKPPCSEAVILTLKLPYYTLIRGPPVSS